MAFSIHVNFVGVLVVRLILSGHAALVERRVLVATRCELLRGAHLSLVERGELLWGNHLKLAVGSNSVLYVWKTVRRLHGHGIETGVHVHRGIGIRRERWLRVTHHLRIHVRRPLHSMARRRAIKALIGRSQLIVVQPLLLTWQIHFLGIRIHQVIGLHLLVFAHKGYGRQTRLLEELTLILRLDELEIGDLLLALSQKVGVVVIVEEVLFLILYQAFGVFSPDFGRCVIFGVLWVHDAQACVGEGREIVLVADGALGSLVSALLLGGL